MQIIFKLNSRQFMISASSLHTRFTLLTLLTFRAHLHHPWFILLILLIPQAQLRLALEDDSQGGARHLPRSRHPNAGKSTEFNVHEPKTSPRVGLVSQMALLRLSAPAGLNAHETKTTSQIGIAYPASTIHARDDDRIPFLPRQQHFFLPTLAASAPINWCWKTKSLLSRLPMVIWSWESGLRGCDQRWRSCWAGFFFDGDGNDDDDGELDAEMGTGARRASLMMWEWELWSWGWREELLVGTWGQWKVGFEEEECES